METVAFLSFPLPHRALIPLSNKRTPVGCNDRKPPTSSVSRRALLVGGAALCIPLQAFAYSSPYKPGLREEQNLPARLYDDNKVVTTSSGLQYFDLSTGNGAEAKDGDTAYVHYTSRLGGLYGVKIQSTNDDPANSVPFIFKVGGRDVVPGVSEAIKGMKVGGKRRAVVPPNIGYQNADMQPAVKEFFARRRLLSVLETNRDATIVFE